MEALNERFVLLDQAEDVAACFSLMKQLRPHLRDAAELVARWQRQSLEGYRLSTLFIEGRPQVLAGFRIQENLVHGRHLYVDDLVTDEGRRGQRFGERMMAHLCSLARSSSCDKLLLDTPLANVLGHRFYYRQGLVAGAFRFNIAL